MSERIKQGLLDFIFGKPRALVEKRAQEIILTIELEIDPFLEMPDEDVVTIARGRIKAFFDSGEVDHLIKSKIKKEK